MKRLSAFALVCMLAIPSPPAVRSQDSVLVVTGPSVKVITTVSAVPFSVSAATGADIYLWTTPNGVTANEVDGKLEVMTATAGEHVFSCRMLSVNWETKKIVSKLGRIVVVVGEGPAPKPPVPPDPKPPVPPDPKPPVPPVPPVPPAPQTARVLIVYESADLPKMPPLQQAIIFSQSVRNFLNAKCAVGPDGKTKEWRIYDKDVDVSREAKVWQEWMAHPGASPRMIITGKSSYDGPLPATVEEALTLLKKHLGD